MATLANVSNFYITLLFLFLIGGIGVVFFNFLQKIWQGTGKFTGQKGSPIMNKWLRMATVSFAGIVIASFALGLSTSAGGAEHDHAAHAGGSGSNISNPQVSSPTGRPPVNGPNGYPASYNSTNNPTDAQIYQLQMSIMQLQQQLNYVMQMYR